MKTLIWILALIVIAGGGYWLWQSSQAPAVSDGTSIAQDAVDDKPGADASAMPVPAAGATSETSVGATPMSATVMYDGNSFSPAAVSIKQGGTVTFETTRGSMWIASARHPDHLVYDGTSRNEHCASGYSGAEPFDQCASGTTYSFTFDKAGIWNYHDHMNASAFGSVTVVQ
ncbi:hypothetical protein HY418_00355 [Candidatus Kaiserbacteria bacterium]|nr:hypothetical protein [Candidatus Kaiserbacteria bacterium]